MLLVSHNVLSPQRSGDILDLNRLKELEKLAGLELSSQQREKLLVDLIQLEKFASQLPELSPENEAIEAGPSQSPASPLVLSMDRNLEHANAPLLSGGFYLVPTTRSDPPGEKP